jgi:acyl-CoA reductase-like NAD-dependent aldehyde dehydrogenase
MSERVEVRKTYKLFVGGGFPRSESGRTHPVEDADGALLAHAPLASRKDLRDAVQAATKAQPAWAARTAYNRGQILFRVAEMLEGRRAQFVDEIGVTGAADPDAEVDAVIDRWVWYAGWTDKIAQVAGSANPVAGPYFNFTVPEPVGVVGAMAPDEPCLLALVSRIAPALVTGNVVVAVAGERWPLAALTLGEVLATSDVPGGVINILSGSRAELTPWMAGHREVGCVDLTGCDPEQVAEAEALAADSVMRVVRADGIEREWFGAGSQSPELITGFCEFKTVWHPAGR